MGNVEDIVLQILFHHEPPPAVFLAFDPAQLQALALTERIIHKPAMLAHLLPRMIEYFAFAGRQVRAEELPKVPFTDKTDARAVLLFCRGKVVLQGNFPHFRFFNILQREEHVLQLRLRKLV